MDPFFKDVQVGGLRITNPIPMHQNQDLTCFYRGRIGNIPVVAKELHRYGDRPTGGSIQHPNLLMSLGCVPDFEIFENYCCNLSEFFERVENPSSYAIDFLSQILNGLQELRKRKVTHHNLTLENVVILDVPEIVDSSTKFILKLKGYELNQPQPAGKEDILKELQFFGRILERFLDEDSQTSIEGADMLSRINQSSDTSTMISDDNGQYLSNLFTKQYLYSPIGIQCHPFFWSSSKSLDFVCDVDEFLARNYENRMRGMPGNPVVKKFVDRIKLFKVENGWADVIRGIISKKAIAHFQGKEDENTAVAVLKCMRNVRTHYVQLKKNNKDAMGLGTNDCYEYFRINFFGIIIHIYRCLEIEYKKMRLDGNVDVGCDDSFMPYIPSVIEELQIEMRRKLKDKEVVESCDEEDDE